jgi:hypothetical protein
VAFGGGIGVARAFFRRQSLDQRGSGADAMFRQYDPRQWRQVESFNPAAKTFDRRARMTGKWSLLGR